MTSDETNKSKIQNFSANKRGKALEAYLIEKAWKEDINGSTKVYLVIDEPTGVIVFFFALKSGLLYQAIGDDNYTLTIQESEIVNLCVESQLDESASSSVDEILSWYDDDFFDKDRLYRIIEERVYVKLKARADKSLDENDMNIMRVLKTFPGIVLTHFCKSAPNFLSESLAFPLGFYVFWEIVTDKVLEISSCLGCQYLYLFAADNTESTPTVPSIEEFIYGDLSDDDETEETHSAYKLVDYYKNELKFEDVQGMTILKPYYDYECFSLIQPIHTLLANKEAAWIQHSDIDN